MCYNKNVPKRYTKFKGGDQSLKGIDIMANKLTKKDKFGMLLNLADVKSNDMLVEFIKHEIDLLAKKNAKGEKKLTANQKANEVIKANMLDFMTVGVAFSVGEVMKGVGIETNQKTSALLRQLILEGAVERSEVKGKAFFTHVGEEADEGEEVEEG